MQAQTFPVVADLVLIGGGHTHALVLRMWGMNPLPGVRLTLINPGPVVPYTGMLPGFVAGHYRRDELMIDFVRLARFAGARLILDRVTGIDPAARRIRLGERGDVTFDVASVNVGITSDLPELPGFSEFGRAAKPLGNFAEAWQAFVAKGLERPAVAVIGGGVAGVELALAARHRLGAAGAVTLLEQADAILSDVGKAARRRLVAALQAARVEVLTGVDLAGLSAGRITLADGRGIASDFTLSATGARPIAWLAQSGLQVVAGYLRVGATLQTSDPAVFAVGDCAHLAHAPRPKAGVFAVRAAPVLFDNLRAVLSGKGALRRYQPQRDYLKLVSLGQKAAVADRLGVSFSGAWMWRLKDRIDRRFMARFADLPAMQAVRLPALAALGLAETLGDKPACGGCGAKVGALGLAGVLAGLPVPRRTDVLSGPGDDAAVLRAGPGPNMGVQVITTDHLRTVTEDPALMARIAAIHALGDIWAMGARAQGALAQVILPRMSVALQGATLAEIMAAAAEVFRAAGADVLGGHSSLGAELTIGFTVTGLADRPVAKWGARAGDVLILTKPLGSGTILAAEMAMTQVPGTQVPGTQVPGTQVPGLLLGEAVAAAYSSMVRSMDGASRVLAPAAHAMTDVTGFGLAGHLLEMLRAGGVGIAGLGAAGLGAADLGAAGLGARISLSALPLLPGAEALAAAGVASTLAPQNRAACAGMMRFAESPRAALLFDPQTCGGLLAAVPAAKLARVLARLTAKGEPAAVIGEVVQGPVHLQVVD